MKKWTRLLAILLSLGMLLSLAACGDKSDGSGTSKQLNGDKPEKADPVVCMLLGEDTPAIRQQDYATPLDYYRAVEQRRADEYLSWLRGASRVDQNAGDAAFAQGELLLTLDQSVLDPELLMMLTQLAGMDLSWFRSLGLGIRSGRSGDLTHVNLALRLNGTDIIHGDLVLDSADLTEYLAVPELNDSYFSVNLAELLSGSGTLSAGDLAELLKGSVNPAAVLDLQDRYLRLILANVESVELTEGTVSAGGVSCGCTVAVLDLRGADLLRIARAVLVEAENDAVLEKLVYNSQVSSGEFSGSAEEFHTRYGEKIRGLITQLDETKPEEITVSVHMTVYIDAKGEVLGRSVEILQDGERTVLLSLLSARDGGKLGLDLQIGSFNKSSAADGQMPYNWEYQTLLTLSGSGTYSSETGAVTGDFLLSLYELSDYNGQREEKTTRLFTVKADGAVTRLGLEGELLFTPTEELIDLILEELDGAPEPLLKLVRSLSLAAVNRSDEKNLDSALILRSDGRDLLTLSLTASPAEPYAISVPTDVVDMDTWQSSIGMASLNTILNNLQSAGVPAAVLNALTMG